MTLDDISSRFATPERVQAVTAILDSKQKRASLTGLAGSALPLLLASLPRQKHPAIVVANDFETAGYIYNDLAAIAGQEAVAILPSGYRRHIKYGQPDQPSQILRTEALEALGRRQTRWIVTSPEALAEKVPAPDALSSQTLQVEVGKRYIISQLIERLVELGFRRTDYVYEPGQFALRGSILDIFSFSFELPFRLDFFDDELESIRSFDIETQLSDKRLKKVNIMPSATAEALDGVSLFEYVNGKTTLFCQSESWMLSTVKEICQSTPAQAALISGEADHDALEKLIDFEKFESATKALKLVEFGGGAVAHGAATIKFECSAQALFHKNFDLIAESFTDYERKGFSIFVLSDSSHQTDRLSAIFSERGDNIHFTPVLPTLHAGFVDNERKNCFFTDHQIFDRFHRVDLRSEKARGGRLAMTLKELQRIENGDFIVHIDHGVGRFAGLVRMPGQGGVTQEMIKLVYQNDDTIYVSIHSLHKLSKYRGKDGIPPKINKLGSGAWNRLKEKTKNKVKDIARDLIKLYAARREEKGFAYSPDSYLQHELEASFVYEDTPDQLKAVQAVKTDMESARPMDRLICGDVGFGKTEIAVRAAFKAATDGKQTALLVPTTVLASQHYHTFANRLKDFPVRVEYLSRARKPKDVKQILQDLAEGKIDIIIGTHKLIGKTVKFKDLGLLIIDEEQKFGVAVKEKLKQLKVNVDTLTMSATPIPRTLQFSLMGARDLSNLNTPPANRRPISTSVEPWNEETLAEAVNFEMSRGGQVFIISNRIERLEVLQNTLSRVVPDARVVIGHGQMPPERLEQAIVDFQNHDYDILLATTIVENGIDMPNVNTIIVDNAQNFGLSELHQLRGRVGRSSRKAFCHLLVPSGKTLTPEAKRRLQAIESFSGLGAGIHIAMQDLDIRGAGNLLGSEQSGFIADLGYETYQKILKESVLELKTEEFGDTFTDLAAGMEQEFVADCTIESDMPLMLPASYVPQESERIALYQQLDNMERPEQTDEFKAALRDRFGLIPYPAEELIRIVPLRRLAIRLGIERILLKDKKMYLYFVGDDNKAYYQSDAFGRMLSYMQLHFSNTQLRDRNGKRSMVISAVKSVEQALNILTEIRTLPSAS